jgi:DNA-binding LacI/PurR family transcriptional regulator
MPENSKRLKTILAGKTPTLNDVCRIADVSKATVSRVLNNHPKVKTRTREKILQVMQSLRYKPSAAARNLSRRKTDMIGLLLPDISAGFYATLVQGAERVARERGYHLVVCFSHAQTDEFNAGLALLNERRIDGLIALQPLAAREISEKLLASELPAVLMQKPAVRRRLPFVVMDNLNGGLEVTRHLIQCGYKKILAVAGPDNSEDSQARLQGCVKAFAQSGLDPAKLRVIHTDFTSLNGVPKVMEALGSSPKQRPDAIFAFNDEIALGLWREMERHGMEVPGDIGLAGFDGIERANDAGLTTFETPLLEMGQTAARLLIKRIEDEPIEKEGVVLRGKLVTRGSTCGRRT